MCSELKVVKGKLFEGTRIIIETGTSIATARVLIKTLLDIEIKNIEIKNVHIRQDKKYSQFWN